MRSEREMYRLILNFAERDERVRLVGLNGSRANKNAPRDDFQDYDIAFLVTDTDSFTSDPGFLDYFGERLIMQVPDNAGEPLPFFSYLMLFTDRNRIDLSLIPLSRAADYLAADALTRILLDKDGLAEGYPEATDEAFRIKAPLEKEYAECVNEFWWVCTYVVKGLLRDELPYAAYHMESIVREELLKMLVWRAGAETGFPVAAGKRYKYIKRFLTGEDYALLLQTYDNSSFDAGFRALGAAARLFSGAAREVAKAFSFSYMEQEERNVLKYTEEVKAAYGQGTYRQKTRE